MRRSSPKTRKGKPSSFAGCRGYLRHKERAASVAHDCRLLSGAKFYGRGAGDSGAYRASLWIARKAFSIGLRPWGCGKSMFQSVILGMSSLQRYFECQIEFVQNGECGHKFLDGDDLLIRSQQAVVELNEVPLIFVGYGIVAGEYLWDDYAGLNVAGKVVVVLPNDPGRQHPKESCFKGDRMTYYGRWEYKFEEAARRGAVGVVLIHTEELFGSAFILVQDEMRRSFRFRPDAIRSRLIFEGVCSEQFGRMLLSQAKINLDDFLAKPWSMKGREHRLNIGINIRAKFDVKLKPCRNVLGKVGGKLFPRQCILLCAHFDHLGKTSDTAQSRGYYPGAIDNAMGVSVLFELARRLENAELLHRTVLFAWTTAEEVGMHGSAQVAQLLLQSGMDVIAALNVDGLVPIGRTRDLGLVDGNQSDLDSTFFRAAERLNRQISLDDEPAAGYFYRSDQASFAKIGIPAVQIITGSDLINGGIAEGLKRHHVYDTTVYHTPADTFDKHWDFLSICADVDVIYEAVLRLSNSSLRPVLRS